MNRLIFRCLLGCFLPLLLQAQHPRTGKTPAALRNNPYTALPLGAITPQGWLREMLLRQKNGATGKLDELYPLVMNNRNGWLGGNGDQWERGPYWIDGLLPLAYILHDSSLIAKTKPWIEWAIGSQQPDGYFGPAQDYPYEQGMQRDNSHDWWPKMVMLKVLQQYYTATGDKRVIMLMTRYFRYQLQHLPSQPLDHWSFWARYRGGDNLMVVYWLYNITREPFLLQLGELLHRQTFDYTGAFLQTDLLSTLASIHAVNLAQGLKEPVIYYQHHPDKKYLDAVVKGLQDIRKHNGMAHGLYGGDEALHGNNPTQGSELCTAVEMLFSLESMLAITGNTSFADDIEKIAFNVLPSQITEDFMGRQYFQQANQIMATRHTRNFDQNHDGTDLCYGLLTGYPCCTSNMHQGWPKFTQNLWYTTADKGIAALLYAPSEMTTTLPGGIQLHCTEETRYPFEEKIRFTLHLSGAATSARFPFHLRIPGWCQAAVITVNGKAVQQVNGEQVVPLNRQWASGDVVELQLPMQVFEQHWYENSVSVERGPLTYALKMQEAVTRVKNEQDPLQYGAYYDEVRSSSPWNYGLVQNGSKITPGQFRVEQTGKVSSYPWNLQNAPVLIKTQAKRISVWQACNDMAGPVPYSPMHNLEPVNKAEEIILVPYGCTRLRIAQFPVVSE
jgi:DUF1680 family protein